MWQAASFPCCEIKPGRSAEKFCATSVITEALGNKTKENLGKCQAEAFSYYLLLGDCTQFFYFFLFFIRIKKPTIITRATTIPPTTNFVDIVFAPVSSVIA